MAASMPTLASRSEAGLSATDVGWGCSRWLSKPTPPHVRRQQCVMGGETSMWVAHKKCALATGTQGHVAHAAHEQRLTPAAVAAVAVACVCNGIFVPRTRQR